MSAKRERQALVAVAVLLVASWSYALADLARGGEPPRIAAVGIVRGAPHAVSLEARSRTDFDGHGLEFVQAIEENAAYVKHRISYLGGGLKVSGVLLIPKGAGPFPLLVLNHGYIDPAIYTNGRGLRREQDHRARAGYAVLHTDYRGHAFSDPDPDVDLKLRLGYVEDAVNAVLAVREAGRPEIDAERVGMLGHSMGGGVTLNALVAVPELVDAAVLFAPVSGETAERIVEAYGEPADAPDFWDGVSAIAHLDRVRAPVMLHHGTADDSTPFAWAERLDAAFREAGKEMTFHAYEGEPHEFAAAWPTVMRRTVEFFDRHLKNGG